MIVFENKCYHTVYQYLIIKEMFSFIEDFSPDQKVIFSQSQLIFRNAISQHSFKPLTVNQNTQTHIIVSPQHQTFYLSFSKHQNYVQLEIQAQVSGICPNIINQIGNIYNYQLSLNQSQCMLISKCHYSSESIYQIKPCQLYQQVTQNIESMLQSIKRYKEMAYAQKFQQSKFDKQQNNKKMMNNKKNKMKGLLQTIAKYKKVIDAEISQRKCSTLKLSNDHLDSIGINPILSTTKDNFKFSVAQQCYESIKTMFLEKTTERKETKTAEKQQKIMVKKYDSKETEQKSEKDESKIVKFIKFKDIDYDNWRLDKCNFGNLRKLKARFQLFPHSLYKDANLLHHTVLNLAGQKPSTISQNVKICEGILIEKQSNLSIDKKMNSFLIELTMLLYLRNYNEETIASYYLEEIKTVQQIQKIFLAYYPLELGGAIEDKDFKVNNFLQICKYLCNGLVFLWKNNLLHRDLKPSNIMLDAKYRPKIIDFGSSKHSLLIKTALNLDYQLISTPGYFYSYQNYVKITDDTNMGQEEYQTHSNFDVYSLGAIFEHIFTKNSFKLAIGQTISMNLDWLVKKCKQPNPDDRPNPEQISIFMRIICQFWLLQNKR